MVLTEAPRGPYLVPIIRILAFGGLFWGTHIEGNYQIAQDSDLEVEGSRIWEIQADMLAMVP